ncbi:hypothetical protein FQN54_007216 [Arachnomyces sp. PD_36]|nr:hypothetical protein FQN54_007216 [Arachnomyces sp. PD_36]
MTDSTLQRSSLNNAQVEDRLNDKIQTTADLQSLDSLLLALKNQQELQLKQLAETEEILKEATRTSKDHDDSIRSQADAFNQEQTDIDRRLMIVTGSDTSNEAVQRFEVGMENLRKLDICKGYMEILKEVDRLSAEGLENITTNAKLSLRPYTHLRNIASALKDAQPAAEGAAPHLVDYTEELATTLGAQMRKQFGSSFQKATEKMKWPSKDLVLSENLIQEWRNGVELLLDLQEPELLAQYDSGEGTPKPRDPPVLLPLELMAHPLALRFKYHFSGNKVTNRLEKPEYFLSHASDLINTYHDFFVAYLQPILDARAAKLSLNMDWIYSDAISLWISALLPMVREKITTFLPQISNHPQLLSHFMHELMNFDNDIRGVWNYAQGPYTEYNWKGLSWEVLVQQDWFGRWLQVEKEFALSRYEDIIDTPDSGQIDYDGVEPGTTKPSRAAIRVNDLLETITERYRPLSSFSQKLRFLIDIQITIFDQFHERLHSSLEAYLAMTSTIGRTVQGSTAGDGSGSLDGVSGLERLCRVFGSAEYLEKKMQYWSDDVFFLELWYELQNRIKENSTTGRPVAGPMTVADVASRTSAAVANQNEDAGDDSAEGALFDETASAYRRLRLRSESIIVSTLTSSTHSSLRPFSRISTWASLDPASGTSTEYPLPPSTELVPTIRTLSSDISFLANALGNAPLRRITRQLLLSIQSYIWDNVLMRHTFSTAGSSQLCSDVDHICGVIDVAVGSHSGQGDSRATIRKLNEGLLLLGLNISEPSPEASDTPVEEAIGQEANVLSLWEVETRVFASNESARAVLSELGIETLSESEARGVLERRAEIRG